MIFSFLFLMIYENKCKVKTQKYTNNINLAIEKSHFNLNHSSLLASVILLFINEQYRKTNKGKKQTKTNKNKGKMKISNPALTSFSLWKKYQSIMWLIGRHFTNKFSLLDPVNSFSSSLIFLIVFFKVSKVNCLVFLVL